MNVQLPGSCHLSERIVKPATVHQSVQAAFVLFFIVVGVRFFLHVMWALGRSDWYTSKPASVAAFLPISGLMSFKRLVLGSGYDAVHPAALTIFLMALLSSLLFRKGFCGYLCPIGWISFRLDRLGKRLGISRRPGKVLSVLLTLPKYVLMSAFAAYVFGFMSVPDIIAFSRTPYNLVVDTRMLLLFFNPSSIFLVTLGVLAMGSMLIPSFWCRGFCPYGALLGLVSWLSPCAVQRDATTCTGCEACGRACPSRIPVQEKIRVSGPECIGCMECVGVCPQKNCLSLRLGYSSRARIIPFWSLAMGSVILVFGLYCWAVATDHWSSELPKEMIRALHRRVSAFTHP